MKPTIVFLLLLFTSNYVYAKHRSSSKIHYSRVDNKKLHYGYTVGLGLFDYTVKNSQYGGKYGFLAEPVKFSNAFYLGVIGEWNVTDFLSLRTVPSLYFGKRTITFKRKEELDGLNRLEALDYPLAIDADIKSVYFNVPLLLKYKGVRINNYNVYFLAGFSNQLDLTPHDELDPEKKWIIRTKKHDFALELGGGIDFYMMYFKLGVELRISIGLFDQINHDPLESMPKYEIYTRTIHELKSTLITLAFNIE